MRSSSRAAIALLAAVILVSAATHPKDAPDHPTAIFPFTRSDICSFLGFGADNAECKAKLAFVDEDYHLYYVDFSEEPLAAYRMENISHKVIAPDISHDGEWVVYASPGSDGRLTSDLTNDSSTQSSAWLCRLRSDAVPVCVREDHAHVPRFVKGDSTLDVVYSTVGVWNAWEDFMGEVRVKEIGLDGTVDAGETVIYDRFACYGGFSYGRRYLATAIGQSGARMVDLDSIHKPPAPIHRIELRKDTTDAFSTWTIQISSPSISSDPLMPDAMMYYDFGSGGKLHTTIKGGDSSWHPHELIFISRYSGEIVSYFPQPPDIIKTPTQQVVEMKESGEDGNAILPGVGCTWYNPEWSTHPNYGVASNQTNRIWWSKGEWSAEPAADRSRLKCEYVYAINLTTGDMCRLIATRDTLQGRTTEFRWPGLWVGKTPSAERFNPAASAGRQRSVAFRKGTISAPAGLKSVTVFSLNGSRVFARKFATAAEYVFRLRPDAAPSCGTYMVRVITVDDQESDFIWFPLKRRIF